MLHYDVIPARAAPKEARNRFQCLVLHGLGDSMEGWKPIVPYFDLPGLGWIFADAPHAYGPGFSWFDPQATVRPDPTQIAESTRLLTGLIEHLLEVLACDANRLILMGFSQGCVMAMDVALRGSLVFAGVVGISGFIANAGDYPAAFGSAARSQRCIVTHGLEDPMIPIAAVRPLCAALKTSGITLDWREFHKVHTLDMEDELPVIRSFIHDRMG